MIPTSNEQSRWIRSATLLVTRLERLSADSYWAHQASGVRGSLLRLVEHYERSAQLSQVELRQLKESLALGYRLLNLAAKERIASRQ